MGQIKVEKNAGGIEGLCVIEPALHGDTRGYFMETYNQKDMEEAGLFLNFVQDNQCFGNYSSISFWDRNNWTSTSSRYPSSVSSVMAS